MDTLLVLTKIIQPLIPRSVMPEMIIVPDRVLRTIIRIVGRRGRVVRRHIAVGPGRTAARQENSDDDAFYHSRQEFLHLERSRVRCRGKSSGAVLRSAP